MSRVIFTAPVFVDNKKMIRVEMTNGSHYLCNESMTVFKKVHPTNAEVEHAFNQYFAKRKAREERKITNGGENQDSR